VLAALDMEETPDKGVVDDPDDRRPDPRAQ